MDKAFYLGFAVRKLLSVSLGEAPKDDIDNIINKRFSTAGSLIAVLTRQLVRNFLKSVHVHLFNACKSGKFINITDFINHRKITAGLKFAFSTGTWGITKNNNQSGVCQVINNTNLVSRLSHQRLVNKPVNRDGKIPEVRQLHPSHFGLLCAPETPEGRTTGLLNSLSFLARMRIGADADCVIDVLHQDMGVITLRSTCSTNRRA